MSAKQGKALQELAAKKRRFVEEYVVDLNATRAAIRSGYSERTAESQGSRLLRDAKVAAAVQELMAEREKRTEITADMVLNRWWEMATADPNELTQFRRTCCRNCFGEGHEFQWVDETEYEKACAYADKEEAPPPSDAGGYGFNPTIRPHPKCPKCYGEGVGTPYFQDTRELSDGAKALYAGVKQTKEGIEVKIHDQAKALENVARHLGMFKADVNLGLQEGDPLRTLIESVSGKTLGPVGEGESDD